MQVIKGSFMIVQTVNSNLEQALLSLAYQAWGSHSLADTSVNHVLDHQRIRNAYALCAKMTAQHSRSFHIASSLLPRAKRQAARALYAFCRLADNIVDGDHPQPKLALDQLRERFHYPKSHLDYHDPTGEILLAWEASRIGYNVPLMFADQLLDGVERDLYQTRYDTFEELVVYCYGVASTVGLMSMHIIGFEQAAIPYAIKLGVALQLTNILRDIKEDWQAGHLYLPQDELATFGLAEQDLTAQHVDTRWRAFMRFQIARNRRLYAEAWPGIAFLDADGQLAVSAAATLYQGILDDIEAHEYDVFSRRAYVSEWNKVKLLFRMYTKYLRNKLR
jgi:phytoene synthase